MDELVSDKELFFQATEVIRTHPYLRLRPGTQEEFWLEGQLIFSAAHEDYPPIEDSFQVSIRVPYGFPQMLPTVFETGERVPASFHRNPSDNSLCLTSEFRQRLYLCQNPNLALFINEFVISYFYSFTFKERFGTLPFGELSHGKPGMLEDYQRYFELPDSKRVVEILKLASKNTKRAARAICPCGSQKRHSECHAAQITDLRKKLGRGFFRREYNLLSCRPKESSGPIRIRRVL